MDDHVGQYVDSLCDSGENVPEDVDDGRSE
jgi:hypothetical protein